MVKDLTAVGSNLEFGARHYFQHPLGFRKFASALQPWLLSSRQTERQNHCIYELLFLLNHMRRKRMWQCFFPSLFIALAHVQFPLSDRSIFPAAWGNTLTYMFLPKFWHCVGNSSGFMGSRSACKNKIRWPLSKRTHWKKGINFWSLLLILFMHLVWNIH